MKDADESVAPDGGGSFTEVRMTERMGWSLRRSMALLVLIALPACGSGPSGSAADGGDAAGLVWVARDGSGLFDPDTLIGIDPATARITRRVGTEDLWGNLAIAAGGFWTAGSGADLVVRIDPRTGRPDSIPLPEGSHPGDVVLAEGSIWVANNGDGTVLRIDPATREVIASIEVGAEMSIDNALRLAAGDGAVWVITLFGRHGLHRIDPVSNTVTGRVEDVGDGAVGIAYGEGSVWVAGVHDGTVNRVDPSTLQVIASTPVGNRPVALAVGEGAVWVGKLGNGTVDRIDPATNRVVASFPVGGEPAGLVAAYGSIWVLNRGDNSVARIDPHADEVNAVVPLGRAPKALAATP
jgi:YVTN family beta-propeller protein